MKGSLWNQNGFFYGIAVKTHFGTFVFKSVEFLCIVYVQCRQGRRKGGES